MCLHGTATTMLVNSVARCLTRFTLVQLLNCKKQSVALSKIKLLPFVVVGKVTVVISES